MEFPSSAVQCYSQRLSGTFNLPQILGRTGGTFFALQDNQAGSSEKLSEWLRARTKQIEEERTEQAIAEVDERG